VKRLQRLRRNRPDIVICRIDKNKAFYIGNSTKIAYKAQQYMAQTQAYEEIVDGRSPLADNFNAVMKLLKYLLNQKAITQKQYDNLCPNKNNLELAHFHGLPKIHKVKFFSTSSSFVLFLVVFIISFVYSA
jgi:hypothetical protein